MMKNSEPSVALRHTVTNEPIVHLDAVSVRVGGSVLLEHIDLAVAAGESLMIVGPNGAGKTTLLRVLLGLVSADAGRVVRRRGLRVGYVPQRLAVDPILPMTAGRFLRLRSGVSRRALTEAAERVGIAGRLNTPLQGLSGGELQRLLLARAMLGRPELLVLDEPAQGLDLSGQAVLFALLDELRGELGCAMLTVSHDLQWVMASADRVVCLNRHVCCTGTPEAVSEHPEYQRLFPDAPPAQRAAMGVYTHHHDHEHALDGRIVDSGETDSGETGPSTSAASPRPTDSRPAPRDDRHRGVS